MNEQLEDGLPVQDELTVLKERADKLGISYHPSIGVDKLREKINAKLSGETSEEAAGVTAPASPSADQIRIERIRRATELVRVRVTCMNPFKREWEGEIFTVSNSAVGTHKKYVPFNAEEGWHVPRIILNQILERQCQIFVTEKDSRGNRVRRGKLIKEFAVEILPPLTEAELKDLAQRQAMARSIDA